MLSHITASVVVSLFVWLVHKTLTRKKRNGAPYPPGPKPKPLIANLLDFPKIDPAGEYINMANKYNSDILHLEALGNHVVIVNKFEDAEELLVRRARIYSDRPHVPIVKEMGWDYNFALLQHDDSWRQHRKICQQNFRAAEAVKYIPVQMEKIHEMLRDLAVTPGDFDRHNKKVSIAIALSTMYGYDINSLDDPCILATDESVRLGAPLFVPGGTLVNVFPILRHVPSWFPGAYGMKTAAEVKRLTAEMKKIPMDFAKNSLADGTTRPSLVTEFLEKKWRLGASAEEELVIENVANTVYGATHPEAQRKAQAELDCVIGNKRLPDITDRVNLPYIEAIYREVMRLCPVLPLGLPHGLSEDDYYKGFFLPKGTAVLPNIWAMTHDAAKYEDPFKFKPERFFDQSGNLNDDDRVLAYGFGRRICVGKHVASSTLWLIMSSVLACFNIIKLRNEQGEEVTIENEFEDFGVIRHKTKFDCSFKVRSDEAYRLIAHPNFDRP